MERELLRLERIEIDGLFGVYNHCINLNTEDRVTLLHGPNGVGKTTALQMVNALVHNDLSYFSRVPFSRFNLRFVDGSTLELTASKGDGDQGAGILSLQTPLRPSESTEVKLARTEAEVIASTVDFLQPHVSMSSRWVDIRDGEVLDEDDVLMRFGGRRRGSSRNVEDDTKWLSSFLANADTHLIEAQRLVRTHWDGRYPSDRPFVRHGPPPLIASVVECSRNFHERLGETMANYGRQAQTLDQTFPQRLVAAAERLPTEDIQARLTALDSKTEEFKTIGILDETPARPFDTASLRDMDDTQARVMTLYVEDTEAKLAALEDLARRARLLLDNLNAKYQHKRIRLDQKDGLVAEGENDQLLALEALSSGEQHEFVLHYDLLFRVKPNTIVLIDEPELSLHVTWQKRFLPELIDIVKLSGFDALVATHSPFIIGEKDELMVGLGESA